MTSMSISRYAQAGVGVKVSDADTLKRRSMRRDARPNCRLRFAEIYGFYARGSRLAARRERRAVGGVREPWNSCRLTKVAGVASRQWTAWRKTDFDVIFGAPAAL
jgi:hypothetical protein